MERDSITKEEAKEQVEAVKLLLEEAIEDGEGETSLEDILMDELGLEPDYLFELL